MQQIKTLIPLSEFVQKVLEWRDAEYKRPRADQSFIDKCCVDYMEQYHKFLKQPLELWMFIPIGDNGEVLEEPFPYDSDRLIIEYNKAKDRCLFEGFKAVNHNTELCLESEVIDLYPDHLDNQNIEMIVEISLLNETQIMLTPTALKQIY